tara:strand:+ start:346 stop:531 length:186 start_codon:yes stop_codon:yes gene_type:complete
MTTNYEVPKWTDKWGYIVSVILETNSVSIEQKGGWMEYQQFARSKEGRVEALNFYNSIITK